MRFLICFLGAYYAVPRECEKSTVYLTESAQKMFNAYKFLFYDGKPNLALYLTFSRGSVFIFFFIPRFFLCLYNQYNAQKKKIFFVCRNS